jgi:hypothetical protein
MALEAPETSSPEVDNLYDMYTSCTHANNLHVETVKYLVNNNYSILILINIKIVLTNA